MSVISSIKHQSAVLDTLVKQIDEHLEITQYEFSHESPGKYSTAHLYLKHTEMLEHIRLVLAGPREPYSNNVSPIRISGEDVKAVANAKH